MVKEVVVCVSGWVQCVSLWGESVDGTVQLAAIIVIIEMFTDGINLV